jgi:hypothetical protein
MSWSALMEIISREAGSDLAKVIDRLARAELGGARIYVPARALITAQAAHEAAPFHPREAARVLQVHPTTVYRALRRRESLIR